jgi:serine/threonine-protein kinase
MPLTTGVILAGRFEILSSLGAGGMGEVYRSKDLRLGRDVAIKVLPEHLASNSDALSRFEREAKAIAALSHPNILAIHDFGSDNHISFAVMELLEGETLRQQMKQSALPWRKSVEIGISTAEGLSAAHSKGVVHRDLKPENIFLTSDGQVKILDFGLARIETKKSSLEESSAETLTQTSPGVVIGTVPYMSPEQVRGEHLDARTDIFSFGCVLFELLSGNSAFARKSVSETIAAILKEDPDHSYLLKRKIPAELELTVTHCLEKNPEQRFQTARDLVFDLKAILSNSSQPVRKQLFIVRSMIVVIILLALIGLIYIFSKSLSGRPDKAIRSLAVLPFENVNNNPNMEYLSDGITESIINDLAQFSEVRVIARDTVFLYKQNEPDPQKIGRALNVDAVVTGRVIQQDDLLTISANLAQVSDGRQLWGDHFSRNFKETAALQEEISNEIVQTLRLKLTREQKRRLTKNYTENPEAYQSYLRGLHYWWKDEIEDYQKAKEYFQKALDLDPAYPLAHTGIGDLYMAMVQNGWISPKDGWPKAAAAYRKALDIDDAISEAHRGLGLYEFQYEWNWNEAEKEFQQALHLDPGSPRPHFSYSWYLLSLRKMDQAIQEMQLALELDPLSRNFSVQLGQFLALAGRYDEAIQQLKKTAEADPSYFVVYISLSDVYEKKKMYREAIEHSQKAYELMGDEIGAELYANAAGAEGYHKARKEIMEFDLKLLNEDAKSKYVSPVDLASIYAQLGDKDAAFEWLEKAYQDRSRQLSYLRVKNDWLNLRSDPRFIELINRIGIP